MPRLSCDTAKLQYWALLLVGNTLLLLLGGFGMALISVARYHPIRAGEPFSTLPFWQQGLWHALSLSLLEGGILFCWLWRKR